MNKLFFSSLRSPRGTSAEGEQA